MSNEVCTTDDIVLGTCEADAPDHPRSFVGTWVEGTELYKINGKCVVCEGHLGVTDCGHILMAVSASSINSSNGLNVHRVGDVAIVLEGGIGVSMTGSGISEAD